ncbi:methyl-CpG-binding domain-containing protein 2 isoform X1 [Lactuca sativa]|nr:methyl-CpG-binding domain-containing protein 2 isoform X1 [Lactuca sativa]
MQSRPTKFTIKMGGKVHEITPCTNHNRQKTIENDQNALEVPTIPSNSDNKGTDHIPNASSSSEYSTEDDENAPPPYPDSQKQMVLYDPSSNHSNAITSIQNKPRSFPKKHLDPKRVVPEVGAFTVQCANCFKWRLIPDQEKYEVIREHITDHPFLCATTRQWDRHVSCDDPTDIEQDGSRIWAIDKPNIAKPPPGWKRLLRLRSEGSSKFADVYYASPTGTKLRSTPEVEKYLASHPEHAQGVAINRFSFQIPKPLRDDYVKKRPSQNPERVQPIAWAGPVDNLNLQIAEPLAWAGPAENRNGMPEAKKRKYDFDCL